MTFSAAAMPTTDDDPSIDPLGEQLPAWKAYELDVHARLKTIDKLANISWNVKREGKVSKAPRQIDVLAENTIAGSLLGVVVECKAYKNPLDVGKVDEFIGKLLDLGAPLGQLYALNGVTPAARRRADNTVSPRVEIHDLSRVVDPARFVPDVDPEWTRGAAEALGYEPCPMDNCWAGEVPLWEWPTEKIRAGYCRNCGTMSLECPDCESLTTVELGDNTCYDCDAGFYVGHDGKGEPADIEQTRPGVDAREAIE